ncbi:MAG TPA: hypothetical protein VJ779_14010 [Acetobacteraceae bacterium]|nr:hypothetical protein [Acetobacteraceae bacterium]
MTEHHVLAFLRIPYWLLIALSSRALHFEMQPYHHLIRIVHILSMSAFFGGIGLLDLRLIGLRATVPLKAFAEHTLPWLYATFGVALLSGIALFFYDPVHVGSHAYFTLKLILVLLGLVNADLFHRSGYVAALAAETRMPRSARVAGAVSLAIWTGVIVTACLNTEPAPRVLLR